MMLATNAGTFLKAARSVFDIVGDLLCGDHEHGDCESKCGINECFQPRHRNTAQTKSA